MASLYRKPCAETMREDGESGYQSDGYWNKYAERLDECDFFAGCGKKNGAVDYCAIAYCYWLFLNVVTDDGEIDDNDRKYMVHYAMYQSDSCCTSAGCEQQVQAYKDNGAWYEDPKDLCIGVQIFYQKWDDDKGRYVYYHTGGCYDWDDEGIYVTEANTNGGRTENKFYPYSEFGRKIAGFGLPRFDGYEPDSNDDEKEPNNAKEDNKSDEGNESEPNTPDTGDYTVNVGDYLNIRDGAGVECCKVGELYDGARVTVFETDGDWGRIGAGMWVSMNYLT